MTNNTTSMLQINNLFQKISHHIDSARNNIVRSVDSEMVQAYWHIGRDIVEEEQMVNKGRSTANNYFKNYLKINA